MTEATNGATPAWLRERLLAYYAGTNERSYLAHWSGTALSFHMGLADEHTGSLDEAHANTNRYLADRLDIELGTRAVDLGCGVGGTAIWLARERGARVTGVTIDPAQVALAQGFAREQRVESRADFVAMDYLATTLPPGAFDVAYHVESLCHSASLDASFAHVKQLLRAGGRYGCLDCFPRDVISPRVRAVCEGWVLPAWRPLEDTVAALAGQGFESVTTVDLAERVARPVAQLLAQATNGLTMLRLSRAIEPGDDAVYEGHLRAAIAMCEGLQRGEIQYAYVGARAPRR